ncbi:MAG: DUF2179 domain-containing protein [Candidatus Thermoplasmatota archaeon]|nr:DUF2179 domain-containing protein [Candidatus Thermoplasmatota archaeon]
MVISILMESDLFPTVILPLLIFAARICDVTLGTLRSIFVVRGIKYASIVGFFEVLIWVLAISVILQYLTNPITYIAYAGGYATGNYTGMALGRKMVMGYVIIRPITSKDPTPLVEKIKAEGYGFTMVDGHGRDGPVTAIDIISKRDRKDAALEIIKEFDKNAFYSVEEIRSISKSPSLQQEKAGRRLFLWNAFVKHRK